MLGDLVYYWRAANGVHQAQGQWLGPALVIGIEGGNVWVSHRATAFKCAKEQLRMAPPAEREMRGMLMRIGGDDPDERSKHGETAGPDTTAAITTVSAAKNNSHHHSLRRNRKNSNYERFQDNSNFIQNEDHR